jgi:hypothetical protein
VEVPVRLGDVGEAEAVLSGGWARARAHSAASSIKATESAPPETPRTIPRAASQGLKRAAMSVLENRAPAGAEAGALAGLAWRLWARFA